MYIFIDTVPSFLKDIANIELGRLTYGFQNNVNGHAGVTAIIFQTAGSNATTIIKDIQSYLKKIEPTLPPGVKVVELLNFCKPKRNK